MNIDNNTKKPSIFTVGHSTRPIDEFIALLQAHGVKEIVDVRSIPMSRYNPQFNTGALKESLEQEHIRYKHLKKLGGLRHAKKDSINLGWHNASFRGFADYMATQAFSEGLESLMKIATMRNTAIMCAEAVPWRCHRSLIGDALSKKGWRVKDIIGTGIAKKHRMTPFLKIKKGQLTYPEPKT
jgi:uncharacterized protein (DUF488 family)